MAAPKTFAERQALAREEAQRQTAKSLRLGGIGVAVLFLSGLGAWLLTDFIFVFLATMVVGILLILTAFLLVRASVAALKANAPTKIL